MNSLSCHLSMPSWGKVSLVMTTEITVSIVFSFCVNDTCFLLVIIFNKNIYNKLSQVSGVASVYLFTDPSQSHKPLSTLWLCQLCDWSWAVCIAHGIVQIFKCVKSFSTANEEFSIFSPWARSYLMMDVYSSWIGFLIFHRIKLESM